MVHVANTLAAGLPVINSDIAYSKVLFLFCPTGTYCREDRCQSFFSFELIPSLRAPLEECESAGAIRLAGGSADVIDGPALRLSPDKFLTKVKNAQADCVIIVTTFGSLAEDLEWAPKIRNVLGENIPIGVRGAPALILPEEILRTNSTVDFCIKGEYELVFEQLVKVGFREAAGVFRRSQSGQIEYLPAPVCNDIDTLPFPDRSCIDSSLYRVRGHLSRQATVRVQRGCPYPCTYCLVGKVSGRTPRHRSPDSITRELKELVLQGFNRFYLRADTFTFDADWTLRVCRAIREEVPSARWVTTTRLDCVNDEILREMRRAGCYGISFGADIVSKQISEKVKKVVPPATEVTRILRTCDRYGIISLLYLMIGFVWETEESVAEVEAFVQAVRPDLVTLHYAHPYPGTVYHKTVQALGIPVLSPLAQAVPALAPEGITISELKRRARRILRRHYTRPSTICSLTRKYLTSTVRL